MRVTQTVPLADNMTYLSTDRSGRYLFGASYSGNKISVNAISEGEINPKPLHVIPTGKKAHCILTDPSKVSVGHQLGRRRHFAWEDHSA
jgi:6-phosphogluconolactonase